MNSTMEPKNILVRAFLCLWLDHEQYYGTQPRTQILKTHTDRYPNSRHVHAYFLLRHASLFVLYLTYRIPLMAYSIFF